MPCEPLSGRAHCAHTNDEPVSTLDSPNHPNPHGRSVSGPILPSCLPGSASNTPIGGRNQKKKTCTQKGHDRHSPIPENESQRRSATPYRPHVQNPRTGENLWFQRVFVFNYLRCTLGRTQRLLICTGYGSYLPLPLPQATHHVRPRTGKPQPPGPPRQNFVPGKRTHNSF
jgi:hypothetical protein